MERLIETSRTLGCLNRLSPVSRAQRHVPTLHEMDDADIADIVVAIKKVAWAARIGDYTVLQNNGALGGQTVWHVHFHLVPAWSKIERLHVKREARIAVDHGDFAEKVRAAMA